MMTNETGTAAASRRALALGALVAIGSLVAACGGTTGSAGVSSPSAAGVVKSTVNVTLQEFAVVPDVPSVPAGTVTFVAKNTGPEDVHELVVIKTDLAVDALPADKDGKVTEDVAGVTLIGEIEDVEVGASKQADLELAPGKYVLICNILQTEPDGSLEAHYKVGMRTAFEVK
jgi:uncharacterized cupredoxin-like copper-binding protein